MKFIRTRGDWAKGQVTGPVSFGLTVTDQGLRASLYNELLADTVIKNIALYPAELREYLDRGGSICWGIMPNNEQIFEETHQRLAERLRSGIQLIAEKAATRGVRIKANEFASRSLVAPACGLGPTTVEVADRVFEVLAETGSILKAG